MGLRPGGKCQNLLPLLQSAQHNCRPVWGPSCTVLSSYCCSLRAFLAGPSAAVADRTVCCCMYWYCLSFALSLLGCCPAG
jgi:hypothetical protein